jgi:cell division protein FtsB
VRTSRHHRGVARRIRERLRALHVSPLVWLAVLGTALLVSLYLVRFATICHLKQDLARISHEQRSALVAQEELRDRLEQKDNPEAIEGLARRLLGLVMPGEEKVIFIEGK